MDGSPPAFPSKVASKRGTTHPFAGTQFRGFENPQVGCLKKDGRLGELASLKSADLEDPGPCHVSHKRNRSKTSSAHSAPRAKWGGSSKKPAPRGPWASRSTSSSPPWVGGPGRPGLLGAGQRAEVAPKQKSARIWLKHLWLWLEKKSGSPKWLALAGSMWTETCLVTNC